MGPADMPQVEHRAIMDSQQLAARKSAEEAFYKDLLAQTPAPKAVKNMNEINNLGQIARMQMPATWKESAKEESKVAGSSYREFTADGKPDSKFCFFYRGRRMSEASSKAFHDLLSKPAHVLSSAELKSIGEVLDAKADASVFNTLSARTEDLNGKSVLIVEGRYREKQVDTYAVFVDSDGTGSAVQEMFYQAPKADFMARLKEAKESLKTVRWK